MNLKPYKPLVLFLVSSQLSSQIICTNVSPNHTLSAVSPTYTGLLNGGDSLDIDLNNDLIIDFRILKTVSGFSSNDYAVANHVGINNSILTDNFGNALAINLNTAIGATSLSWQTMNSSNITLVSLGALLPTTGYWANAIDKYLGLKLLVGTNTYYGWARFTVKNSGDIIFKDYAYNSVPNQSISAGQGCASFSSTSFFLEPNSCVGYSTNLTANTGTLSVSGYTWNSSPPGIIFSGPNTFSTNALFSSPGTYSISLNVSSGTNIYTYVRTVTIFPLPNITAVASPTALCTFPGSFTISGIGGATTYTFSEYFAPFYTVTIGSDIVSTHGQYPSQTFSVTGSVNGCASGDTVSIYYKLLNVSFTSKPDSLCPGTTTLLSMSNPSITYTWIQAPATTLNVTGPTVTVTPLVFPAFYTVVASNGICIERDSFGIAQKTINISISAPYKSSICKGDTAALISYGAANYTWMPANSLNYITGSYLVFVSPTITTTYTIFGTYDTCTDVDYWTEKVDLCLSVKEESAIYPYTAIFPNPACEFLHLNLQSNSTSKIYIINSLGEIVLQKVNPDTLEILDISYLPSGLYVVKISSGEKYTEAKKLLIQR